MPDETHDQTPPSSELDEVLAQYVTAEEAGQLPNRQELLSHYPHLADDLRAFFANRDQMQRLAAPFRLLDAGASDNRGQGNLMGKLRYFGDYELLEEIAAGGMGVVYKARQVSLNRIVAVKMILKGTLASEDDVKRFQAEAEAAANLQHPAIVAIHEVGLHEGQHYFSMDFIDGRSLAQIPREQPLTARQAAEYVREAAEAVHHAHQQGTLHRDLKPSNILIDGQGRVRITDFGLAKRISVNSDLTLTGQILGTPSYMPPEQASGKRSLISAASDIYALGAVLYELLTGRPPFRGESPAETLRQVESLDPFSPRLLNPAAPRDLETICLKCLEKEPHKRYGTAQLLADDLGRYLRGEPIVARPIRAWQRGVKWVRRHPTAAGLVATSAIAIVAMVGLFVGQSYNARLKSVNDALASAKSSLEGQNEKLATANNALGIAKAKLETSNTELGEASTKLGKALEDVKAERSRARHYLYAARMALVQRAEQEKQPGRIIQLLRSVIPETPDQEDLRDFEWHFLWRKYHGEESRLRGHTGPVLAVACSPDGKWIASGSADRTVKIWNAITGKELRTLSGHADRVREVAFSLDSTQLVSLSADKTLKVWNFKTGQEITDLNTASLEKGSESHRRFWKPFGGESESHLRTIDETTAVCLAHNADRDRIVESKTVYGSRGVISTVKILNPLLHEPVSSFNVPTVVPQVALSPDGAVVAAAGLDQLVRVWNSASGDSVCTLHAPDGVQSIAFSPDGSRIVAGTENRLVMLWTIPGTEERTIHQGRGSANCVTFGAGGTLLAAVCDANSLVWNSSSGQTVSVSSTGKYSRIAMSATHSLIASEHRLTDVQSYGVLRLQPNPGATQKGTPLPRSSQDMGYDNPRGYAISDDELLVAEASENGSVNVHDAINGKLVQSVRMADWAWCVAFSPGTKLFAAGSGFFVNGARNRGSIIVREVTSGRTVFEEKLPIDVWWLCFSPDGKWLAAAMGIYNFREGNLDRIRIWSTANWQIFHDLRGHTGCVWSLNFNASGTRLVSAGGHFLPRSSGRPDAPGEFKIWDTATGEELLTIPAQKGAVYGVAFSPDGTRLATAGGDGSVRLWNGTPLAETPAYEPLPRE